MTEDVRLHLERAQDCIAEGELLSVGHRPGAAISRAYYAMFHAATAALLQQGIQRRSHQGIVAAFGQTFVKSGPVDPKFHRYLKEAFDLRKDSDYQPMVRLTDTQAQKVLDWAREFAAVCKDLCA